MAKFLVVIVLALTTQLAVADGSSKPPLRVGIIAPLTGDFANFGQGAVRAMELANETESG